jgi:hypothetical protein
MVYIIPLLKLIFQSNLQQLHAFFHLPEPENTQCCGDKGTIQRGRHHSQYLKMALFLF